MYFSMFIGNSVLCQLEGNEKYPTISIYIYIYIYIYIIYYILYIILYIYINYKNMYFSMFIGNSVLCQLEGNEK